MIVILILLVTAAALVAVLGIVSNTGSGHEVGGDFSIADFHLTNLSTGELFLYGVIVGAVGMLAASMLLGVVVRRRALHQSQRRLESSRHATDELRVDNELLTQQLDDERAEKTQATPVARVDPADDPGNGPNETVESAEQDSERREEPTTDEAPDKTATPDHSSKWNLIGRRKERQP